MSDTPITDGHRNWLGIRSECVPSRTLDVMRELERENARLRDLVARLLRECERLGSDDNNADLGPNVLTAEARRVLFDA